MKRRLFWLLALAGVVWLYLKRGGRRPERISHVPGPAEDPAEELRRKLDATREEAPASHLAEPEPPHADPPEPVEPPAPVVSEELDARRREIHERARASADEMRDTSSE